MMANIQVRLPDDDVQALDALADTLGVSRSDAVRVSLHEGITALRLEDAWRRYAAMAWSLERAAQEAGVGLARFADFAAARGTPYVRYSVAEADRDRETVARFLKRRDDDAAGRARA